MVDIRQSDNKMEQSANLYLPNFYTQLASGSTFADHRTEKTMPHHRYYQQHHHLHQQQQHTQHHDKPEQIDQLVALELQHLKTHYADEEQRYVDQMLIENPVVVERRSPAVVSSPSATSIPTAQKSRSHGSRDDAQRQRAESCRKSRYNNKIKKAKLRFRHKFVCSQLNESAGVLDYMREVIAQAETQLLARGFNRVALERMRQTFGVNQCNGSADIMDQ